MAEPCRCGPPSDIENDTRRDELEKVAQLRPPTARIPPSFSRGVHDRNRLLRTCSGPCARTQSGMITCT
jgi:hypothetical protein